MTEGHAERVFSIQDELPEIIRLLREPAGPDPRFASLELIRQNYSAFVETVHSTWKKLHKHSLAIFTLSMPLFFDGDGLSAPAKNGASLAGGSRSQGAT